MRAINDGDVDNVQNNVAELLERQVAEHGRDGADVAMGTIQALRVFVLENASNSGAALLEACVHMLGQPMNEQIVEAVNKDPDVEGAVEAFIDVLANDDNRLGSWFADRMAAEHSTQELTEFTRPTRIMAIMAMVAVAAALNR